MGNMTVHHYRWCSSNNHWETPVLGSNGDVYTVTWGPASEGSYSMRYSCNCYAGKFHPQKECKHVRQARPWHCLCGCEALSGAPTPMGDRCPKCGEPTAVVTVAT
jgi:hypothetical protein